MSEEEVVIYEENEAQTISTIRINRPAKKNAISWGVVRSILKYLDVAERSESRVIIITGSDEIFSSGIDLNSLMGGDPLMLEEYPIKGNTAQQRFFNLSKFQQLNMKMSKMEKPIIARIAGICWGIACELMINCDFRFCLESSSFTLMEGKYGFNPDQGGMIGLVKIVGIPAAKDLMMTARKFDGKEAYRLGLMTGVAKSIEEMDAQIKYYIDEIIDSAPLAVGLGKKMVDWAYGKDTDFGIDLENLINSYLLDTRDMKTGAMARMKKKRFPKWRGK
ncbi:MAG: enoyl-CoA hydratase/isomerase family protein [Promethearchaeota archaeon]